MKIRIKKFISFITAVAMTITLVACGANEADDVKEVSNLVSYITRGQWIQLLAQGFGLDSFTGESPYYTDVNSDDEIYTYVQACYEWNILSTGTDTFKPDDVATLGFVITTSVLAAELDYEKYATSDDLNESIINCANEYGLTNIKYSDSDELNTGVTPVEASTVLNSAVSAYMAEEEEVFNVIYRDTVIDNTIEQITTLANEGKNIVLAEEADKLDVGSVLLMPTDSEHPYGYTLKVISKDLNSDGTYTIETVVPEIYEVFEEIDVDQNFMLDPKYFEPAEGVTVIEELEESNISSSVAFKNKDNISILNSSDYSIDSTKTHTYESGASNSITLGISLGSSGLKIDSSFEKNMNGLKANITNTAFHDNDNEAFLYLIGKSKVMPTNDYFTTCTDLIDDYISGNINTNELKKKLEDAKEEYKKKDKDKSDKEWDTGWTLSGKVIMELGVDIESKIHFTLFDTIPDKLEEFSVSIYSDTKTEIQFKGEAGKEFKLGKFSVPVAAGFGVGVEVKLFIDVNGTITYTYTVKSENKLSYSDGKFKKTHSESSSHSGELGASIEAGLDTAIAVDFWGFDLAKCGVKISAKGEVKGGLEKVLEYEENKAENTMTITDKLIATGSVMIYAPLVTIYIGGDGTLIKKIGIDAEFGILTEDNTQKIKIYEAKEELILDKKIVPLHEDETTTEDTTTSSGEDTTTDNNTNTGYLLTLSEFVVAMDVGGVVTLTATLPEGYSNSDLVWSSSDSSVATVSNGTIKGVSEGSSTITVTTKDGKYKVQCFVTVN
ncbi:MAG: Ig-like domain-containing protein [Lachnospiraceae bacterium]|nr:Ig-like domain-containing protein [Lachnospiraceae bacterium]